MDQIEILSQFASENPNPVLRVAANGVILYANAACEAILGELSCRVGEQLPPLLAPLISDVSGQEACNETQADLGARAFAFVTNRIKDADYFYIYGHDISRLKEKERELVRLNEQAQAMALHDPLTGLPNRTLLQDRLAQAIAQCARSGKKLALVFIDLDNFKPINDVHGHLAGDRILVEVARCVGGTELACNPLTRPLTLSMGVAIHPDDASLPEGLFQQADAALYQAKALGRNRVVLCGESGEWSR